MTPAGLRNHRYKPNSIFPRKKANEVFTIAVLLLFLWWHSLWPRLWIPPHNYGCQSKTNGQIYSANIKRCWREFRWVYPSLQCLNSSLQLSTSLYPQFNSVPDLALYLSVLTVIRQMITLHGHLMFQLEITVHKTINALPSARLSHLLLPSSFLSFYPQDKTKTSVSAYTHFHKNPTHPLLARANYSVWKQTLMRYVLDAPICNETLLILLQMESKKSEIQNILNTEKSFKRISETKDLMDGL